jgi:copper chaperone NosL
MISRRVLLLGFAAVTLTACRDAVSADEPPKLSVGRDTCHRCRMMISEERHAAAIVDEKGSALLYDDTGEMIVDVRVEGLNERRVWVHDYQSGDTWLDGTKAYFVVSPDIFTPMGTGVVAFEKRAQAEVVATEQNTTVMTWEEVLVNLEVDSRMS